MTTQLSYSVFQNRLRRGVYWFHCLSVRPSSVSPSVNRIVSAVYLQQYSPDPFDIYASYQATSDVSYFFSKLKNLNFWQIPKICKFNFVLFWLVIQYESIVIMGGGVGGGWVAWGGGGGGGYPHNAGVLVVLVVIVFHGTVAQWNGYWSLCFLKQVNQHPHLEKKLDLSRVQSRFIVEHMDIIVTQKISPWLVAWKPSHQQIVMHFGGNEHYNSFWLRLEKYLVTMDPYLGTLIPSKFVVPWLLTHFPCDTIDINDSFLDGENISHAMCWLDEFERMQEFRLIEGI